MIQTKTLYDKLMDTHVVREEGSTALIYIDRQLIHEVTSPQAFESLKMIGRKAWRLKTNLAVPDHNVPTINRLSDVCGITDSVSKLQIETLNKNCTIFGINEIPMNDIRQGIVHVVGSEQGNEYCLWRFTHFYSWRTWCFSIWYWYFGSRTCFSDRLPVAI